MMVSEALPLYCKEFKDAGGNPDACEGVQWSNDFLRENPHATLIDWIQAAAARGSASWILAHAFFLWPILSEDEHLECINALAQSKGIKTLLNRRILCTSLTENELKALRHALISSGSLKSAERLEAAYA